MDILNRLNDDFNIKLVNGIAYDLQCNNEIIANSKKELIQFYIESYKYKIDCLFNDETDTKKHYESIIKQLETLLVLENEV